MVTRDFAQGVIERTLESYARIPYAYGDLKCEAVFDRPNGRFLLVTLGWQGDSRVHNTLVHIDLIGEKIWIQSDRTESGVASELVAAGIPRDQIVLGFRAPELRHHTGFAVA